MKLLCKTLLAACLAGMTMAQQPDASGTKSSANIRGRGCVKAGVEQGCIALEDTKSGQMYTLFFESDEKPPMDAFIAFRATEHQGMTTCMQGKAVTVVKWRRVRGSCSASKK